MSRIPSGWLAAAALLVLLARVSPTGAHSPHTCPRGFNDAPTFAAHLEQAELAAGRVPFTQVFDFGRRLFIANFNACDGAGRPGSEAGAGLHGVGESRSPDPFRGPRFTVMSGPDANSCASCHNEPAVGGAAGFAGNLFEGAVDCDPVASVFMSASIFGFPRSIRPCRPDTPAVSDGFFRTFSERGSLGLFGAGTIELLGREMTEDLWKLRDAALARAAGTQQNASVALETKGVRFGTLVARPDGSLDTSGVQGVSPDLVIRPFGRKGQNKSIRHFAVQAFNRHHGMQPVEAVAEFSPGDPDPDRDGVASELTVGDMTAAVVFQAALPVPGRARLVGTRAVEALRGEQLFEAIGCEGCHVAALPLRSTLYCEPNPLNTDGDFRDTSQPFCFDLRRTSGVRNNLVVAYTDMKRHTLCDPSRDFDPETNHFCDDPPFATTPATDGTGPGEEGVSDRPPYHQFLTARLWDVGNSGPWGHRNDLDTIYAAILHHGGEAVASRNAYRSLPDADQLAVVNFLKTLVMPIMAGNPQPQEVGSARAGNPAR